MRLSTLSPRPQRHLAWLLWFVLLLPIAQTAAAWHAVQHQAADAVAPLDDKSAPHVSHCDLCLAGAAVDAGAPPPALPAITADVIPRAATTPAPVSALAAEPPAAYLSRAPPPASS